MSHRQFTPYELNQLRKYGLNHLDPTTVDQTPVEYLTGHAEFFHLDFLVNPSTLIPRLESEEIIPLALSFLNTKSHHLNIADIGTGSGCLGISLAHSLISRSINDFDITLSDNSPSALKTAQSNVLRLLPNYQDKFHFLKSDLLSSFSTKPQFDLILANLPYIPSSRLPSLDSSVKDYEPVTALDGGPTGAELINHLLSSLRPHVRPIFQIILEIDSLHTLKHFTIPKNIHAEIKNDHFDRPRFLVLINAS